ncbi:MAG: TraR/DksA C4-type zinc finger protein [Planctomycetes bacterium]|nr:TraR/DksA C4-type zinc finger protein [Planctomycetota bacterium]
MPGSRKKKNAVSKNKTSESLETKPVKKASPLTPEEVNLYKSSLVQKKKELISSISNLSESVIDSTSGELSTLPQHLADAAINTYENYVSLNLAEETANLLRDIDSCLQKIQEGVYGLCENCTKPILKKRLKVVPYTRLCIDCQHAEESNK